MLTTYGPPVPPDDPDTVGAAFAHGVRDGWLSLPGSVRWLLVGWVIIRLLVQVAESESATAARVKLWFLVRAHRFYSRHRQWWTTDPKDASRVLLSDLRADSEDAAGEVAAPAVLTVATEPVSLVEPDVSACTECGAPKDPMGGLDDLFRGLFTPEAAEPGLTGWKPGMPDWGTPPWRQEENDAQARRFRQMIADALRRHEEAGEQK